MTTPGSYWHPFADMAAVAGRELVIARGEGVHVWDADGARYLDGSASLWHCHVGHGREEIVEAIARQMRTLEAYQTFGDLANGPRSSWPIASPRSPRWRTRSCSCASAAATPSTPPPSSRGSTGALQGSPQRTHLISRSHAYHGTHGFGTSLAMEPLRRATARSSSRSRTSPTTTRRRSRTRSRASEPSASPRSSASR